jgi:DNA-binding NarL/FixJ family response regulator
VNDFVKETPLRIVIAEDSGLLRAGIARLLTDSGHQVVAEAQDGPSFLLAIEEYHPDVVVVEARSRDPHLAVLVLSQYVEERYGRELLESGAEGTGYLLKDRVADVGEFVSALEEVGSGGTVLDPEVVGQLLARRRRDDDLSSLTPREREVLALVAEGRTNHAIASTLFVTEGAVEKHVKSIFGKLGLAQSEADHRRVLAVLAYLRS